VGFVVFALEDHEVVSLLGRRVRVQKGRHTFIGTLRAPSERKFTRGPNRTAYGCILEGKDFRLEFAWWDWTITPVVQRSRMIAAE
jgi:hypothetical protein